MKVVINTCFGGFSLSKEACNEMGLKYDAKLDYGYYGGSRTDPNLVRVVERLGERAGGQLSRLEIVEIPDDVKWTLEGHDGSEWVAEVHRTWP